MEMLKSIKNLFSKNSKDKQPLSNTTLLLTITICTFVIMYLFAMIVWGGGFLNPQQFLDIFNNNAYLIIISCGLTIVMITGGIDISVGGSVALITMASVVVMEDFGGGIFTSLVIASTALGSCPKAIPPSFTLGHEMLISSISTG